MSRVNNHKPQSAGPDKPAIVGGTPVFAEPLEFNRPTLPAYESLSGDIRSILESGQLTNGPYVSRLERQAEFYFGRPAVALANCTSGLILAAKLLGLTGQVIVPSFTFFATSHALIWNGLEPLFVDIDRDTWNIDPIAVAEAVNPGVSAVMAVDIFGNPSNKDALREIADRHGLKLLTDAAHSLGALYRGRAVGGFGDAEIFSLSPTKLVTGCEGGLVAVDDEAFAEELRIARDYGNPGDYNCRTVGLNARMTEINALIAAAGMDMLDDNVEARNRLAHAYRQNLSGLPGLTWQKVAPEDKCTYKDISVLIDPGEFGIERDALRDALAAENIPTRAYYDPPAHEQAAYKGKFSISGELAVTKEVSANILSLPVWSHMTEAEVDKVCAAITRIAKAGLT